MTIRRVAAIAVIALVAAQEVVACSGRIWEDNDLVENEPDWSANRRFCAVVRWHEGIADFTSKLAGAFFRMDDDRTNEEIAEDARALVPRPTVIAALYESQPWGRVRINEIPLDIASVNDVLVSDSGRYLVAVRRLGTGGCTAHATKDDPFVTIYRADGSVIASWKVGDVLEASDLLNVHISATFALRH